MTLKNNETEFEYDIFLCHNSKDKQWVEKLATLIENETTGNRNLKVFYDDWDIKPGENIVFKIEDGLKKSKYAAIIISHNSKEAEWPSMEWTIAINSDPSGRRGHVIPIWLGGCEIPPSLKIRNVLYCRNEAEFQKSYTKLIALLKEKDLPRGNVRKYQREEDTHYNFPIEYEEEIDEQLASNLLPVIKFPKKIWSGPVGSITPKEVFEHLSRNVKGIHPPFFLRENQIFTFWNLKDRHCPFQSLLLADTIKEIPVESMLEDSDKSNWLIELFNKALRNFCWDLELLYDRHHNRFFFRPYGGQNRIIEWNTGKRKATRSVVKKYRKGKHGNEFWVHQSFQARFMRIADEFFLQIVPGWTFTIDGESAIPPQDIGSLSTKWMHNQYNSSMFYHLRFWINLLARSSTKIIIPLGQDDLELSINPAVTEVSVGIEGDLQPIERIFETVEKEVEEQDQLLETVMLEDKL